MCSINVQHLVGAEHSRINKAVFWTMKILIFIFKHWVLIFLKEILIEYTTSNIVSPLHMNLETSNFQRMCVCMSNYISQFPCLGYVVMWVLLYTCSCTLLYTTVYRVQYYSILISGPGCLEASVIAVVIQLAQYQLHIIGSFFKTVGRIESSKESEPAPSTSGLNEISASLPSAIAEDPSTLPSPPFLSLLQSVTLLVLLAAPVCQRSLHTTILYKVLYCKIKMCSLFLCLFYVLFV